MSTHKEGKRRVLSNLQPHARRQCSNATRLSHSQSRLQPARSRSFCFSCQMSSLCCSGLALQWRHRSVRFFLFLRSNTRTSCSRSSITFVPRVTSSSTNDDAVSAPKPPQLGYDPSEDLFGLEANSKPRNVSLGARKPRSWFGPNGQYIRELPCPSCRGRGYTPCSDCGIERSRSDCSQCVGKVCAFSKAYCAELLIDKIIYLLESTPDITATTRIDSQTASKATSFIDTSTTLIQSRTASKATPFIDTSTTSKATTSRHSRTTTKAATFTDHHEQSHYQD
ncbi:hypothetical protein FF1_011509 [Malus domestica]